MPPVGFEPTIAALENFKGKTTEKNIQIIWQYVQAHYSVQFK
jgi:hypothetical protein